MKTTLKLIIAIAILIPCLGFAETKGLESIFDKYKGQRGVSVISINPGFIEIDLADGSDNNELEYLMNQVDKIKILSIEHVHRYFPDLELHKEVAPLIKENDYSLLIDVNSSDEALKIYVLQGEKNRIKEGLIVTQEDNEAYMIWVYGDIKLSDFMKSHRHLHHIH